MRARAAHQLQQQRLGLVVAVMRERDERHTGGRRHLRQRRVAQSSRFAFKTVLRCAGNGDRAHRQRDIAFGAEVGAKMLPVVRMGRQAVMDVQRDNTQGGGVNDRDIYPGSAFTPDSKALVVLVKIVPVA